MSNEIATYSMILSKLSLGKSGTECPTKTQILAINSLIVIDNASTYGANECVKIDDIRKKAETWNYYLTVSPTSMSFGAGGGSKQFTYSSYKRKVLDGVEQSGDISVSLKTTSASGTGFSLSGTTVTATANETTSNRTGTVTITQNESNKTATISLSQSADSVSSYGEWVITVSANPTSVSNSGGTSTITASAKRTIYWTSGGVTEETGNPTLSTNLGSLSSSSSPSTLTLGENSSTSSRTATIKATHGGKSATCTVTQAGAEPTIEYVFTWSDGTTADQPMSLPYQGSSVASDFDIISTKNGSSQSWSVSSKPSWVGTSTSGNTLKVTIDANTGSARNGAIVLTQSGSNKTLKINVSQAAKPAEDTYSWQIKKSSEPNEDAYWRQTIKYQVPAKTTDFSGGFSVKGRKNGEMFASYTMSSDSPSWLTIKSSGNGYIVNHNTGSTPRSGTITLTQAESGLKCYIEIYQYEYTPTYGIEINPSSIDVSYAAQSASFTVNSYKTVLNSNGEETHTPLDYTYSSSVNWFVPIGSSTTNVTSIGINANTTTSERSDTFTLTQVGGKGKGTVTVTQEGKPADYLQIFNDVISTTSQQAYINFKSSQPWSFSLDRVDIDNPVTVDKTSGSAGDSRTVALGYFYGYSRPRYVPYTIKQTAGEKLSTGGYVTFN